MFEQFKNVGSVISAGAAVLAAALTLLKGVENAGHELPPILLALGVLTAGLILVITGLTGAALALLNRDRELAYATILEVLAAALFIWSAHATRPFATLLSGEYQTHPGTLIAGGATTWAVAATLLLRMAHRQLKARKASDWAPRGHRLCPECAEFPKRAARVCRHCGHRFAAPVVNAGP